LKTVDSSKVKQLLFKNCRVAILTHTNPDGDAIGSALALYHYLKIKGIECSIVISDIYPDFLAWMPDVNEIRIFENDPTLTTKLINEADLLICLDFNSPDRLDEMQDIFVKASATKLLIDHHIDRGKFCDFQYSRIETSSTAELVYDFIEELGDINLLDQKIATCLYVGIMTDTGSFSYACNYERTFLVTAGLLKIGIDVEYIHRMVYDTYSENRVRLLGYCLSEKLQVIDEFGTAYIALSREELDRFGFKTGDTEGVVNFTLGIKGVVLGALLTERNNKIKISLRSKGSLDVNHMAKEYFNGGGHRNAAGGDLYCTFDEAVAFFKSIIPVYAEELKKHKE
jgi:bifunctional oligoribonuclease and PAP phosphatase NrnA